MTARLVPLSDGSIPILLDKAITLIGRHPDCDAVLDENQKISRRHCCIAQVDNRLVLRDLGSMNGVRVNGETVVEVDLVEGDEITIGDEEFVLELKSKVSGRRRSGSDLPTPEKPKRSPKPAPPPVRVPRRTPPSSDLSQEFPVPISEDDEVEDLRPARGDKSSIADKFFKKRKIDSATKEEPEEDNDIFKLDSGEIQLGGFGHP